MHFHYLYRILCQRPKSFNDEISKKRNYLQHTHPQIHQHTKICRKKRYNTKYLWVLAPENVAKYKICHFVENIMLMVLSPGRLTRQNNYIQVVLNALVQWCRLQIERSMVQILHWPNVNFSGHNKCISRGCTPARYELVP